MIARYLFLFRSLFQWHRIIGISALSAVAFAFAVLVLPHIDATWIVRDDSPHKSIRVQWPILPFFTARTETAPDGKSEETYLTVPTRQLTAQELAQFEAEKKESQSHAPSAAAR